MAAWCYVNAFLSNLIAPKLVVAKVVKRLLGMKYSWV
jgi:hypothetical protein